jgi:hypothetical protein
MSLKSSTKTGSSIALVALLIVAGVSKAEEFQTLEQGQPAPSRGLLIPPERALKLAQTIKGCEAERDALAKTPATVPWGVIVAVAIGGVLVGGVAGAYVGTRIKP